MIIYHPWQQNNEMCCSKDAQAFLLCQVKINDNNNYYNR